MPQSQDNSVYMTTREAARQLGVSLSTVQGWVENGVLKAWKTPGGHRRIPSVEVEKMRDRQTQAMNQQPALEKTRVLIVEDEQAQQEIYKLQFESLGLPVDLHIAENGFQGLVMFGRLEPQLIITDLSMPEIDGFKMISELISLGLDSNSIIVVTGLSRKEITRSGELPDGITVLSKPLELADIKSTIGHKIASLH